MEKDIFILQLNKEELEGLQSALDATVKAHGIAVAAKCGHLLTVLQKAKPVPVPEPVPEPEPELEFEPEYQTPTPIHKKKKRR